MSSQTIALNNGQQAIVHTDRAKIFLWNRRSSEGVIANSTYSDVEYPIGTVMGRIGATGKLVPLQSAATNGSQFPVGVLMNTYTVEASSERTVTMCDDGDVDGSLLVFDGSDSLNTQVSNVQLRDWLKRLGIKVITTEEMTGTDNQ